MPDKVSTRPEGAPKQKRPWVSERMKKRWADPAYREKRRQQTAAKWEDLEYRQKQQETRESEDYMNRMRSFGIENAQKEEVRENLKKGNPVSARRRKGSPLSEEHRRAISDARREEGG